MVNRPSPEVVAHRGYALHYPENTLSAIRAAIDSGARYVEIDVQMSSDGVPVLFHDEDTQRLCEVPGLLQDMSLAAIRDLRPGYRSRFGSRYAAERVPTLSEFAELLARHPAVNAFVEIKPEAVARHGAGSTFDAVRSALSGVHAQSILISFDLGFLAHVRQRQPTQPIAVVAETWHALSSPVAESLRADYAFCDLQGLPAEGQLLAPHGARLIIYEVGDAVLARALATRGVPMIETFACGELLRDLHAIPS
jgi:glycerophosphoryl diester phosphodiesterase